jgi:hypothetical protein
MDITTNNLIQNHSLDLKYTTFSKNLTPHLDSFKNQIQQPLYYFNYSFFSKLYINAFFMWFKNLSKISFSFGFYHLRALVFILFIDACLTDDEPL